MKILDVNTNSPEFGNPWTPTNPYIDIEVVEEEDVGVYVTTIVATDPPSGTISEYRITSDPGQFFNIDSNTGNIILP